MRFVRLIVLSAMVAAPETIAAARQFSEVEILPSRNRFPVFSADPLMPSFSVQKIFGSDDLIAKFGATIPLIALQAHGLPAQVAVAGAAIPFLQSPGGGLRVVSTDFHFFAGASLSWSPEFSCRLGYGHTSHHLNDDAIVRTPALVPLNYARDYLSADGVLFIPSWHGLVYWGINYAFQFQAAARDPKPVWILFGGVPTKVQLFDSCSLYCAFNLRFRQEFQFAATQNYQLGIEFTSQDGRMVRRVGLADRQR